MKPTMRVRVLRCKDVMDRTGLSRATIYRQMKLRHFPRNHRLCGSAVGWSEREVEDWIEERLRDTAS
jgi:prophage regulatory protein